MTYSFEFVNADGSVDRFDLGSFETDEQAKRAASSALLVSTTALRVKVLGLEGPIAAIDRPTAPSPRGLHALR